MHGDGPDRQSLAASPALAALLTAESTMLQGRPYAAISVRCNASMSRYLLDVMISVRVFAMTANCRTEVLALLSSLI